MSFLIKCKYVLFIFGINIKLQNKKILFLLTALLLISCNRDINSDADLFVSSTKMKLELDNKLKKIWASGNEFSLENLEKKKSIF